MTLLRLIACCLVIIMVSSGVLAEDDHAKRPMQVHKLVEMGIEVWTEYEPLWITETIYRGKKPIFTAQTPSMVYPPAAMSIVAFPGMTVESAEMMEVATNAIVTGARNYHISDKQIESLDLSPAEYGELKGYEAVFSGKDRGDDIDVKVFIGNKPGKGPVMMQIFTLKGKLPHLSEQIQRSWGHIKYL